jgi:hypothetical protein
MIFFSKLLTRSLVTRMLNSASGHISLHSALGIGESLKLFFKLTIFKNKEFCFRLLFV